MAYQFKEGYEIYRLRELEGGSEIPPIEVLKRDTILLFVLNRLENARVGLNIEMSQQTGFRAMRLKKILDLANKEFEFTLDELNRRSSGRFDWE
jgi:hypothetical protein